MENIDFIKLRYDLINYFGTAMFNGFAFAIVDLSHVEKASYEELIEIALKCNFNLDDYVVLNR